MSYNVYFIRTKKNTYNDIRAGSKIEAIRKLGKIRERILDDTKIIEMFKFEKNKMGGRWVRLRISSNDNRYLR